MINQAVNFDGCPVFLALVTELAIAVVVIVARCAPPLEVFEVLGLAVDVEGGLLFLAAIAVVPVCEIIILAVRARPAVIRELH